MRAEFGHPDVSLALTCLSYYYTGLTHDQLRQCFDHLLRTDNPEIEYEEWTRHLSESNAGGIKQLRGVNIEDPQQFEAVVYPKLRNDKLLVDFYLSQVVFPKSAKDFPSKLSTSGWDLAEERGRRYITGFSGTNDNRHLLPTSIMQSDPTRQSSTNALVLSYLLQHENNHYVTLPTAAENQGSVSHTLLSAIKAQTGDICILLDVGAQVLDCENRELATFWLSLREDRQAAVYFTDKDELVVVTRDGNIERLIDSTYRERLGDCLIYLDDAHTRGTDLKLPQNARAAVTLGPKVTKDRLMQGKRKSYAMDTFVNSFSLLGCMRMRQLGHGQSITFFAPIEVDRAIRETIGQSATTYEIQTSDIITWALGETCADIRHHIPHWVQQGLDYRRRLNSEVQYRKSSPPEASILQKGWLTPESRPLEELYGLRCDNQSLMDEACKRPDLRKRLKNLGVLSLQDPSMDEEQEREVSHEVEVERQVQRPGKMKPMVHQVHEDVRHLVLHGVRLPRSTQFVKLQLFLKTNNPTVSPPIFVTQDFLRTVQKVNAEALSDYSRPVNWVLSAGQASHKFLVVLSPFEVNELLPDVRGGYAVSLHIFNARVTESMRSMTDLSFYSIVPRPLKHASRLPDPSLAARAHLGLWAGQLYLDDFDTYSYICSVLGTARDSATSADGTSLRKYAFSMLSPCLSLGADNIS